MHHCERGLTVCSVAGFAGGVDVGVCCSTYSHVRVPESDIAGVLACHVDLDNDGTWSYIGDCEANVLDLGDADVAGVADLHDSIGIVGVTKGAADARYHGPSFSNNASSGWDKEGGLDDIDTVREVGELTIGGVGS